jgi:hypothetical protein
MLEAAKAYHLELSEDAAQAIGPAYAFSDGIVKRASLMGNYGDFWGRPKVTNSQHISEKLSILAGHGAKPKYYQKVTGENSGSMLSRPRF